MSQAGKGDRDRTTDKKAYDACPLWDNIDKKKKKDEAMSVRGEPSLWGSIDVDELTFELLDRYEDEDMHKM